MTMMPRDILRTQTRAAHERAEAAWIGPEGFGTRAQYDRWLACMGQVHAGLGARAEKTLAQAGLPLIEDQRAAAILQDLGQGIDTPATARLTEAEAWGVLYALNGSAMGASHMLKGGMVAPDWPHAYLQGMKDYATSGALKQFFDTLNALDIAEAGLLSGAHLVFDQIAEGADAVTKP